MIPPEQVRQALELLADARRLASLHVAQVALPHEFTGWLDRCDRAFGPMSLTVETAFPEDVALFLDPKTGKVVGMIYNIGPDA